MDQWPSYDPASIRDRFVRLGLSLSVAESLTCGWVQAALGIASGASDYFKGGMTAYTLDAKVRLLAVDADHAGEVNCASPRVAEEMAEGVCKRFESDYGLATTGYAEADRQRGVSEPMAWYAIWRREPAGVGRLIRCERVDGRGASRDQMQRLTAATALADLQRHLEEITDGGPRATLAHSMRDRARPLVVFVGQGLSLADGFDLTRDLQAAAPECFEQVPNPYDLDLVLESILGAAEAEERRLKLERALFELSRPGILAARRLRSTTFLCQRLGDVARNRTVVLATSNVDCALRGEALRFGAEWIMGRDAKGTASLDGVRRWFGHIKQRPPSFHYLPLHGEPDLLSTGDGGTFFSSPEFQGWKPAGQPWYSTVAEGLGPRAREIHRRFSISQDGYKLLEALLSGEDGSHEAADLLVVGCGSGSSDRRLGYPFEIHVNRASKGRGGTAIWQAVGVWEDGVDEQRRSRLWFEERGFLIQGVERRSPSGASCMNRLTEILGVSGS
jgi:nicotinamide-nucleotide amidase